MGTVQTQTVAFRPEVEILLHCARVQCEPERVERLHTLLQQHIDWGYLLQVALPHGMMPLLYWQLQRTCPEAVPEPVLARLRNYFQANARRNTFLAQELMTLLHLFNTEGITALPIKGPVFAAMAYGDVSFRQCGDLDIVIPQGKVLRAQEMLISQGYNPAFPILPGQATETVQFYHERTFLRQDGKVIVDLHWRFVEHDFPFPLSLERVWQRCEPVLLEGTEVRTLARADALLIHCMHGSKHLWERLQWICDVAELIRPPARLDWAQVLCEATTLGSQRMLGLGLSLANDLLGAHLPAEVTAKIGRDAKIWSLATQVRLQLFSDTPESSSHTGRLAFFLHVRGRLRDRVGYAINLARDANDNRRWRLPLPAFFSVLYYLLWPLRLLWRYGVRVYKALSEKLTVPATTES
jgi:hypothetical protein